MVLHKCLLIDSLIDWFLDWCDSVFSQYNLVLTEGRWHSSLGTVTAGLAESNDSLPLGLWLKPGLHYPSSRPELTARELWCIFWHRSWRAVNSASGNACPSTRPVLTGNGNRSPVNWGRQLGWWKPGFTIRIHEVLYWVFSMMFHAVIAVHIIQVKLPVKLRLKLIVIMWLSILMMTSQGCMCVQCVRNGLHRKYIWKNTEKDTLEESRIHVLSVRNFL